MPWMRAHPGGIVNAPRYVYEDEEGAALTVNPYPHAHAGDVAAVRTGGTVYVLPEHFPEVAAGLWTGAGLPPPVILEPPGYDTSGETRIGAFTLWREDGNAHVNMAFGGCALDSAGARHLAAAIVAYGDGAEAEPDPGEVEELAALIVSGLYPPGVPADLRPSDYDRTAARTALRWMRDKQREAGHA